MPTKGRRVKSGTTNGHERAKDFLDPSEMDKLLEAAKRAGTAPATTCCCL